MGEDEKRDGHWRRLLMNADSHLIWEGYRHPHADLTHEQEEEVINMLQASPQPIPSAEDIMKWINTKYNLNLSTEKSVANKRLEYMFIRHKQRRIKRAQGHSKV